MLVVGASVAAVFTPAEGMMQYTYLAFMSTADEETIKRGRWTRLMRDEEGAQKVNAQKRR